MCVSTVPRLGRCTESDRGESAALSSSLTFYSYPDALFLKGERGDNNGVPNFSLEERRLG